MVIYKFYRFPNFSAFLNLAEFFISLPTEQCSFAAFDPCNNYKFLNSSNRLVGNTAQSPLKCDKNDLNPGWYRFSAGAGDRMPTSCPPKNRCGTYAPGWLAGAHPTVTECVVTRTVCYHWRSECCYWNNKIRVKNCGPFYVYELQKPPACPLRYCSGEYELLLP